MTLIGKNIQRWFIATLMIVIALANVAPAAAQSSPPPTTPGIVKGIGVHFAVTDSDWLNVTVDSTVPIHLHLSSSPKIILMHISADQGPTSTAITLGGLEAGTNYWKYDDNATTGVQFTADGSGNYTFTQDLTTAHTVRIQAGKSTYSIYDDGAGGTGGHCASIGTWNGISKTCTLTQNVNDSIYLYSSGVTLDGAGFTATLPDWGSVQISGSNHTVKNLTIQGTCDYWYYYYYGICYPAGNGIYLSGASNINVTGVTVLDTYYGVYLESSSNNTIQNSTFSGQSSGAFSSYSDNNTISDNIFSANTYTGYYGWSLWNGDSNTFRDNTFSGFYYGGIYIDGYINSYDYWYYGYHYVGSCDCASANNTVYRNNFLNISYSPIYLANWASPAYTVTFDYRPSNDYYGSYTYDTTTNVGNVFNLAVPDGGNYYSQYDQPGEGCNDTNSDGFCDAAYGSGAAVDNLPRTTQASADTTAPTASPTQSPVANGAGWNKTDVIVTWNWTDNAGGSGIDTANCTTSTTSSGEGSALTLNATCKDLAGNTGNASYMVKVDKTKPTLSPSVSPNLVLLNGTATATSGAADALSGLASDGCGALDTSTAGTKSVTCTATDAAGNSNSTNASVVVYDPNFFLHGSGATANPSTLFLDGTPPATTVKSKDSAGIKFSGGNPWTPIGTWMAQPGLSPATLSALSNLRTWIGLKNSDDQGTRFDLRAEVYKNDMLVASGEILCIQGVTRNPDQAKEVAVSFSPPSAIFNGTTDVLSLKVLTRIGTNGSGAFCGGHSSATGLRLYFDATSRPSKFAATFNQ